MGPGGWFVLLASLQGVVLGRLGVEDEERGGWRAPCRVTRLETEIVQLMCGDEDCAVTNHSGKSSKNSENSNYNNTVSVQSVLLNSTFGETKVSSTHVDILATVLLNRTNNFDSFKVSKGLSKNNRHFFPSRCKKPFNCTSPQSIILNKTVSHSVRKSVPINFESRQYNSCTVNDSAKELCKNVMNVHVILVRNISILDLSSFPNATNVTVKSDGQVPVVVFGAKNVSTLTFSYSNVKNASFICYFSELKHLNFSHNLLSTSFIKYIPLSVTSCDVSHNNISFDKNTSFPESVKVLNISNNGINSESGFILKGNVIILDLSRNRLNDVPIFDMVALEELYLSENNISQLVNGTFKNLSSLTFLDLRSNGLNRIEEDGFSGLNKLQKLDLSENKLKSLAPATFQYLNNLVFLTLSRNDNLGNLQNTVDAAFLLGTGQRLQKIEASKTNISRIPTTLTRTVRKLFIADNNVETIQCGELDSYPLLQIIDISNNKISEIEEDAFGRLEFLSHLLLSANNLTTVPKSLPNQLEVLDLRKNSIGRLHNYDFLSLQKLTVLLLSRNDITDIDDGAFGQLVSLEVLDLSFNPIKTLYRTSLVGPRKLKEIYLISLTNLIPLQEPLSFPAPESAHLEVLNMEASPVLATQLMDDVAALTMFHELFELNMNHCTLSTLRSDLPQYLPRLHKLELTGNTLNCTNIIWLVRWLQALNISMQDSGRFRKQIYNLKDRCEEGNKRESNEQTGVMCASPAYLSGRTIISLKEEDFPDFKLTSAALSPTSETSTKAAYLDPTFTSSTHSISDMIDSTTTSSTLIQTQTEVSKELLSVEDTTIRSIQTLGTLSTTEKPHSLSTKLIKDKMTKNSFTLNKPQVKKPMSVKRVKTNIYKYNKDERKTLTTTLDPDVVLLNVTNGSIKDVDNHSNETLSPGAFSAPKQLPPVSHPGMFVFFMVLGCILVAAALMIYSHYLQLQKGRGREYQQHQDIEVSSLGGPDLW